ncbi:MAG: hypothetical protein V1743_04025 [Nanoarchaeota archaeon]
MAIQIQSRFQLSEQEKKEITALWNKLDPKTKNSEFKNDFYRTARFQN